MYGLENEEYYDYMMRLDQSRQKSFDSSVFEW